MRVAQQQSGQARRGQDRTGCVRTRLHCFRQVEVGCPGSGVRLCVLLAVLPLMRPQGCCCFLVFCRLDETLVCRCCVETVAALVPGASLFPLAAQHVALCQLQADALRFICWFFGRIVGATSLAVGISFGLHLGLQRIWAASPRVNWLCLWAGWVVLPESPYPPHLGRTLGLSAVGGCRC